MALLLTCRGHGHGVFGRRGAPGPLVPPHNHCPPPPHPDRTARVCQLDRRTGMSKIAESHSSEMVERSTVDIQLSPLWNMHRHQGLEEATVIGNAKMQEFMGNHKVLKRRFTLEEVGSQGDGALGRA